MKKVLFSDRVNNLNIEQNEKTNQQKTTPSTINKINIRKFNTTSSVTSRGQQHKKIIENLSVNIIPNKIHFSNILPHQLYEMTLNIRNESKEIQKIRIIPPQKKQFRLNYNVNLINQIATGLSIKISVLFYTEKLEQFVSDRMIIFGNQFKQEIPLIAETMKENFQIQSLMNIGTLKIKDQKVIKIAIKNKGSRNGFIGIQNIQTNDNWPHLEYKNTPFLINNGVTQMLEIKIKPIMLGELELRVKFSNKFISIIKGLVVEEHLQLVDENGLKMMNKDLGELLIGEKVSSPFFIVNGTENQVECLLLTINKKKQQVEIKVDKKRNIFVSHSNPSEFSKLVEQRSFSLESQRCKVSPFQSSKNLIHVQKVPTKEQIDFFLNNLTRNIPTTIYKAEIEFNKTIRSQETEHSKRSNHSNAIKNSQLLGKQKNVIHQTLAFKFSSQQKIFKIPLKFTPVIPNVEIDLNSFEFGSLFAKQSQSREFILKNFMNKRLYIKFDEFSQSFKQNFKIQGPEYLQKLTETKFKVIFRPLIKKKFLQNIVIKVLNYFPIQIKLFGECFGLDISQIKSVQRNLTMNKSQDKFKNLLIGKNQLTQIQPKTRGQSEKKKMNLTMNNFSQLTSPRNLISQRTFKKQLKSEDSSLNLFMTIQKQNLVNDFQQTKENLFFKKDEFLKSINKKKPFNHPSNLREILQYEPLQLQELKKIQILQKNLDFGHIFIGSKSCKKLTVVNNLDKSILFEIDTQNFRCLNENKQQAVKIQAFAIYEVQLILSPTELGQVELPLTYVINRQHIFEIKVSAIVTLVNLELSARVFTFNLSDEDQLFETEQTLTIYNHGNKKARFTFQTPQNHSFQLDVLEGQIQPKLNMNVKIKYYPFYGQESGQERVDVEKLKLKVQGGAENIIKCTGTVKQPKILIKQAEFNYDRSLVSIPLANKVTLKNLSTFKSIGKIILESLNPSISSQQLMQYFSFESLYFQLQEEQKKQLHFTFVCHELKYIHCNIVLQIRGFNIVKIPFMVVMVYPQIQTPNPLINFEDISIMSNCCFQTFHLINKTNVEIKLELDQYPKQEYFIEIIPVKQKLYDAPYEDFRLTAFLNSFSHTLKDNKRALKRKSNTINKTFTLPINSQNLFFHVKFCPKIIKVFDFMLPIKVSGTGDRLIQPVNIRVKCNAIGPIQYVTPSEIKFETKVIIQNKNAYNQSFFISNPHNYTVQYKIQYVLKTSANFKKLSGSFLTSQSKTSTGSINQSCYSLSNYEGEIEPNQKVQVIVSFKAITQGQFNQNYNIILSPKNEQLKAQGYALSNYTLKLSANAILPTLKFHSNQAIMPVVPLNFESRVFLVLENHGYDAITICKWKTTNYFPHTEIKVNFIEGKLLSLAKKSLRIEVILISHLPISFTTILQFYDEFGNKYDIPLSCTTDNCLFTVYPYLEIDPQHRIYYYPQERQIKISPGLKNPFLQLKTQLTPFHSISCDFIMKWLNFQFNMSIEKFPESIIESEGRQFAKMINRISSKNIAKKNQLNNQIGQDDQEQSFIDNMTVSDLPQSQKENRNKVNSLVDYYADTIKKLKSEGAFLNHLRPEYLLSYPDYVIYVKIKKLTAYSQQIFTFISIQSWISLFYQLCKVFIQPQITQKLLTKMKIQFSYISSQSTTSNIYSPTQMILLKFLNFYNKSEEVLKTQFITNFTDKAKNLQVIQRILQEKFNLNITEKINNLKYPISLLNTEQYYQALSKLFYEKLKQFGLQAYLKQQDLMTMGTKEFILYLITLIQLIYHYQNTNEVKFEGAVGDKIAKIIQIENPTNKKIHYSIKIVDIHTPSLQEKVSSRKQNNLQTETGSTQEDKNYLSPFIIEHFDQQKNQLIIDAKHKKELKITYQCKNAKNQLANMYLIPTKQDENFTIPQPLMFKLTSKILSKIVMKKINVTTSLYEATSINLEIQLPSQIPEATEFSLSLYEQTPSQQGFQSVQCKFNQPSFFFNQSHTRILRENSKDSIELKLVPLSLGQKICKISYLSSVFGEFIYEIYAKIQNPKISKEFKITQLKVNKEEQFSIIIPKQNDFLNTAIKQYYPTDINENGIVSKKNLSTSSKLTNVKQKVSSKKLRYDVQVIDCSEITLMKESQHIEKFDKQNKIFLKANFNKPYRDFHCLMMVKNEYLRDFRLYRISCIVASLPKIINVPLKTFARKYIVHKIPIKIAPCEVSMQTTCKQFTIQNFFKDHPSNTELVCHFKPDWILKGEAKIEILNKQTFEQIIYNFSLQATQPQRIEEFEITCSQIFSEQIALPINLKKLFPQINFQQIDNMNQFTTLSQNRKSDYFELRLSFQRQTQIDIEKFYPFLHHRDAKHPTGLFSKNSNLMTGDFVNSLSNMREKQKTASNQKYIKQIKMVFSPSQVDSETGSIKFYKPNTEEYHWAKVIIKNRPLIKLKQIYLKETINSTKKEYLQQIFINENIDFTSTNFQFKFQKNEDFLELNFEETDINSNHKTPRISKTFSKRPVLIFNPIKQVECEKKLFFKFNNKEYLLPLKLKSDVYPSIFIPEIITYNTQPKHTTFNLINNSQHSGYYRLSLQTSSSQSKQQCIKLFTKQKSQQQAAQQFSVYFLKPKQKKQFSVNFEPTYICQKQQAILRFESQTLPNYTYVINGKSEFKVQQENIQFEVYQDNDRSIELNFNNFFNRKQEFQVEFQEIKSESIIIDTNKINNFLSISDPYSKKLQLDYNETKKISIKVHPSFFSSNLQNSINKQCNFQFNTKLTIVMRGKVIKIYNFTVYLIRNLFSQNNLLSLTKSVSKQSKQIHNLIKELQKKNKYTWACKARQTVFESIQIPEILKFNVKEIKCDPEISKFLTFTNLQKNQSEFTTLKIKYSPMKPIKKKKYDVILIGSEQKYRIQCEISVESPDIDDTIVIKTPEIGKVTSVSFKLTNTMKSSAKYKAYFIKKLPQFSVQSSTGVLQSYGKPGTSINIQFKCQIANRKLQNILIIETEDMYWSFKVKGMISRQF